MNHMQLPEPTIRLHGKKGKQISPEIMVLWDEMAMREYAAECVRDALERAAKVCDARFMGDLNREDMEARACAAAIRALKEQTSAAMQGKP